jgi:hypothetical protein
MAARESAAALSETYFEMWNHYIQKFGAAMAGLVACVFVISLIVYMVYVGRVEAEGVRVPLKRKARDVVTRGIYSYIGGHGAILYFFLFDPQMLS